MQVDGDQAVGAGGGDQVGDQLGADRGALLHLAVLARVAEVRGDGDDGAGRGALERVDHHQQLHQVVVDRRAGRLHHEAVHAADVLADLDVELPVGEAGHLGHAGAHLDVPADALRQVAVGIAGEDRERLDHRCVASLPSWAARDLGGGLLSVGAAGFEPADAGTKIP